ncbi:MAG TPA: substrate-binding domain-containing protein [Candidatus Binatia bacterium]|nr:substrate-binding domain-containing protein [Candidatus Binatia bacterium]
MRKREPVRKPAIWVLVVLGILTILNACAPSGVARPSDVQAAQPRREDGTDFEVGLLLSSLYDPLYVDVQSGAVESASRLDVELIVREAGNNPDTQLQQIKELLALEVDALVLNPVDSAAIGTGVRLANEAGVPVITVERRVSGATVAAHVASDNISGGEIAAGYLAELLQEEGNIVELVGIPGTSAAQDRGSGFNRVIGAYPAIEVVAREVANFDRRQAKRVFADILEKYADLDGVFAHNDEMILGAIDAADEAGRTSDIYFVGFDGSPDAIAALEEGLLTATVAQQPVEMGRIAVELAVAQLRGDDVDQNVVVDLALVTR